MNFYVSSTLVRLQNRGSYLIHRNRKIKLVILERGPVQICAGPGRRLYYNSHTNSCVT